MMSPPPIVQRLQTGFLANVRANVLTTPYLPDERRATLSYLLREGAPVRVIADVTSIALAEGMVHRLNTLESGSLASGTAYGPGRLFEPFPFQASGTKSLLFDRDSFFQEIEGHPLPMGRVLEITYPAAYFSNATEWLETSASLIHSTMNAYGFHFYHKGVDGMVTVRHTTVTLFEMGLRYCFGDQAARLCETKGPVSPEDMNELHKERYHPHGLPFERHPIHLRSEQDPAFFGPHDNVHATIWSSSVLDWQRITATLFYDAMRATLSAEELVLAKDMERVLLDLNVMDDRLFRTQRSFKALMPPSRVLALLEDFVGRINRRYKGQALDTGLLQFKRSVRYHIRQLRTRV